MIGLLFAGSALLMTAPAEPPPRGHVHLDVQTTGDVFVTVSSREDASSLGETIRAAFGCLPSQEPRGSYFHRYGCPGLLSRTGLVRAAVLDFGPVAAGLGHEGGLSLTLSCPRLGVAVGSVAGGLGDSHRRIYREGTISAREPDTWKVRVGFGWRPEQLGAMLGWLLAAAVVLAAAVAFVCRRGLAPLAVSLYILGASLWLSLVWALEAGEPARLWLGSGVASDLASIILGFLLPLGAAALGVRLGRPGSAPGLIWFGSMLALPLGCFVTATPYMIEGQWLRSAPWLALAFAAVFAIRRRLGSAAGGGLMRVTEGPLHDRVANLAARAGCPGAQLYVSLAGGPQPANAFALPGRAIVLNAASIELFPKPELDAVIAHEVSHLRHQPHAHWAPLALAAVAYNSPIADLLASLTGRQSALVAAIILACFGSLYAARKREFAADEGGVRLNGDPLSFVRALARLSRVNNFPLRMSSAAEWFSTHPSTLRRIEAIARIAGLSAAETRAAVTETAGGDTYALPAGDSALLYSPEWQEWNGVRYAWGILVAVPAAALVSAFLVSSSGWRPAVAATAGIVLGCAGAKLLLAGAMSWGYKSLERKLRAKLRSAGNLTGLAPGGSVRSFGGQRYCDAGLLSFEGPRLCYRSERITVELHARDVSSVGLLPASPVGWLRNQPVVHFRRPAAGRPDAFILHPLAFLGTGAGLKRKIDRWRKEYGGAAGLPGVLEGLEECPGAPFERIRFRELVRGFRIPGCAAVCAGYLWGPVLLVAAIAAAAYAALVLPYYLYRTPAQSEPPA